MNVNYFGSLPINPDNIPENSTFGQGTERPIGFSFNEIFKLTWTVRSFKCNFSSVSQNDPLSQFLQGGGSLGILGTITSLNNINLGSTDTVVGETTISTIFKQKERNGLRSNSQENQKIYTWDGIINNQTITKISIGNNQKTFNYKNNNINEGNLLSGPLHLIPGKVTIDLSNIKFYQNKYWPIIILTTPSSSSKVVGSQLQGGISFLNQVISMYSSEFSISTKIAFGDISIGKRFFFDGRDYL